SLSLIGFFFTASRSSLYFFARILFEQLSLRFLASSLRYFCWSVASSSNIMLATSRTYLLLILVHSCECFRLRSIAEANSLRISFVSLRAQIAYAAYKVIIQTKAKITHIHH